MISDRIELEIRVSELEARVSELEARLSEREAMGFVRRVLVLLMINWDRNVFLI